jgi:uncharacterized protein
MLVATYTGVGVTRTFHMRTYKQGRERLVAACDEEVLGRQLKEGSIQLHVDPGFYDGSRVDEEALEFHLRSCTIANLVGAKVVDLAVRLGFVDPGNIIKIEGVPHAQWALMI